MPDILSSDELSDLLAVVDDQEGANATMTYRNKTVSLYDFRRPTRLSRAQMRLLQRMYESALEGLTGRLSEELRTPFEANVLSVKALNYGAFASTLPVPTYVNIFKIEPLGFRGLFTIDAPFCLALVDRLLGGHGHAVDKPRHLTNIEMVVLDWPVKLILGELQRCWRSKPLVKYASETRRMDLSFVQVMHTAETILRVSFAFGGEIGAGEAHLCLPFTALEALGFESLRDETLGVLGDRQEQDVLRTRENLKKVSVPIAAELGSATLNLREVVSIKPGQVIKLNTKANKPVPVRVGQRVKFYAMPGLNARTLAIQITGMAPDS